MGEETLLIHLGYLVKDSKTKVKNIQVSGDTNHMPKFHKNIKSTAITKYSLPDPRGAG